MAAISITQRAGKGYTVVFSDDTYYFSQLFYRANLKQGLTLYNETLLRTGMRDIAYTDVTINSVTGFASMSAVCDALDAIGINAYNPVLTDGSQQTKIVDESGNFLHPAGTPHVDSAELTRLANTTAYAANDAINSIVSVAQVETITLTGTAPEKQVDTVTLTGASGTADITGTGGLTKEVTFAAGGTQDLTQTAADFVTSFAADYLAEEVVLTSSGADLIFTSTTYGLAFVSPVITNTDGDLDGTVANTQANVVVGEATITGAGGLELDVVFDTDGGIDLTDTAADFVTAYEADYASEGITLTSSGADLIFTAAVAGVPFTAPVITNTVGDLDGSVVNTTANVTPATLEFQGMAIANGGGGIIMDVKMESNITALASKTLRAWIYNEAPTYVQDDNAAHANYYVDRDKLICFIDVTFEALNGSSDTVVGTAIDTDAGLATRLYKCADTSLFVSLQTIDAFTPTSGGKINVTLNVLKVA